jgi:hypothetical protein
MGMVMLGFLLSLMECSSAICSHSEVVQKIELHRVGIKVACRGAPFGKAASWVKTAIKADSTCSCSDSATRRKHHI